MINDNTLGVITVIKLIYLPVKSVFYKNKDDTPQEAFVIQHNLKKTGF